MFDINQFRELIVRSTLRDLVLYSENAEELLIFTCATESNGGHYLKQVKGVALGIYQMEPETYYDLWHNYILKKGSLSLTLMSAFNIHYMPDASRLIYDLQFATVMARIFYRRIPEELPDKNNIDSIWDYYKRYYNTRKGAAVKDDSIKKYHSFISG